MKTIFTIKRVINNSKYLSSTQDCNWLIPAGKSAKGTEKEMDRTCFPFSLAQSVKMDRVGWSHPVVLTTGRTPTLKQERKGKQSYLLDSIHVWVLYVCKYIYTHMYTHIYLYISLNPLISLMAQEYTIYKGCLCLLSWGNALG